MSRKPYSDYDLGFIQDHDDWTAANIAEAIGHSIESVRTTRLKMRKGWIPRQSPEWSESEDDFLRANLRMSGQDAAAHLGRPVQGVRNRRMRLGLRIGGNWSPVVIGARPLLAKTCPKCGFLLQAKWFSAGNSRSSICNRCIDRSSMKRPAKDITRVSSRKSREKFQALTIPGATRHGQPYVEADYVILQDPDMTVLQKALALHRTYLGTKAACVASGFKSHVGLGDPERDQWIIDNPNAGNAEEITASLAPLSPIAPAEANQPIVPQWDWDESDLKVSA